MGRMSEHLINTAELLADLVCARLATGDCSDEAIWAEIRSVVDSPRMRRLVFEAVTERRAR